MRSTTSTSHACTRRRALILACINIWTSPCRPKLAERHLQQPAEHQNAGPVQRANNHARYPDPEPHTPANGPCEQVLAGGPDLITELAAIGNKIKAANAQLAELVDVTGSKLEQLSGIGPSGAARLIADVGAIKCVRTLS